MAFWAASAARCSPRAFADAHHRAAGVGHDRLHVREVEVDQAGLRDQVGDALDALAQHVVGVRERLLHRRALLDDLQNALVGNRDERVDLALEVVDAALRDLHALAALERERLGDDRDGQRARFARQFGDDRRRTGAGAAAHAGGDEDEVGAVEYHREIFARFFRRFAAEHSGLAPAPSPRVSPLPMWTVFDVLQLRSACTSVLTAKKSTPVSPASTMRLTALQPPPPMPTTLIVAACSGVTSLLGHRFLRKECELLRAVEDSSRSQFHMSLSQFATRARTF